jgi:hypothetical protein
MSYAAKLERSGVRIVDTSNGSTKRTIAGTFTQAVVQGNEAHCTRKDGKIQVVNISNGSTIRII